jgi:hypothetical protein
LSAVSIGLVFGIAAVAVIGLLLWTMARNRAADAFFAKYAGERGMTLMSSDRARLPTTTPLLRGGDERYAERLLEGPLGDGNEGLLANYTYEEQDSDGTAVARHPYTLAYLLVPESVPVAPELFVRPRSGPESWDGVEDAFAGPRTRIRLESGEVERRYEIFASEMQDQVRLRRLFSPSFVVWLAEQPPAGFGFELFGGKLCSFVPGHAADAASLDGLAAAAVGVATRLRDEALENAGP